MRKAALLLTAGAILATSYLLMAGWGERPDIEDDSFVAADDQSKPESGPIRDDGQAPEQSHTEAAADDQSKLARDMLRKLKEGMLRPDASWRSRLDKLCRLGNVAVREAKAATSEWNEDETQLIIMLLRAIPTDESTDSLLRLAVDRRRPKLSRAAISALENRPIRGRLSEAEVQALSATIQQEKNVVLAGAAARVLGMCQKVPASVRAEVVLARFVQEIERPSEAGRIRLIYVSPRAYTMNLFLLAFLSIGEEGIPVLQKAARSAVASPSHEKWLQMALGMAGDPSVADQLRQVAASDPNKYIRATAIRPYARAAGRQAVPFLRSLLRDESRSEYHGLPDGTPVFLIRPIAQGELARIGAAVER